MEGVITEMPITTAERKAQRRLEVKARSTLMMSITNEHQLNFNSIKDAKKFLEAVEKRFVLLPFYFVLPMLFTTASKSAKFLMLVGFDFQLPRLLDDTRVLFIADQMDICDTIEASTTGLRKPAFVCIVVDMSKKTLLCRKDTIRYTSNPVMDTNEKLIPNNGQAVCQLEYSRVIGCLMYVMTCSRPDIAFAVGELSRYTSNPGYTDASWISNTEDNSSTNDWVFLLGRGAISWASNNLWLLQLL
nr:hypothetical protein [Tanacetum cinerariifolium]